MTIPSTIDCPAETAEAASITDGLPTLAYVSTGSGVEAKAQAGWQPVNEVNRQAWEEIERRIALARQAVCDGKRSCLSYYMVAHQMDCLLLGQSTGQSPLLVWLHLRPFFFRRMGPARLRRYAELFQVDVGDLLRGELRPPIYQHLRA